MNVNFLSLLSFAVIYVNSHCFSGLPPGLLNEGNTCFANSSMHVRHFFWVIGTTSIDAVLSFCSQLEAFVMNLNVFYLNDNGDILNHAVG